MVAKNFLFSPSSVAANQIVNGLPGKGQFSRIASIGVPFTNIHSSIAIDVEIVSMDERLTSLVERLQLAIDIDGLAPSRSAENSLGFPIHDKKKTRLG